MTRSTRSTTELLQIGLEATTFVLIRQMLSVAFEAVEVFFGLSAARILPAPTSGRPVALRIVTVNQVTSGRSFFFFFVHFPPFLRLRLLVSRYPDIWISGCQRSGYLRGVCTCRIETFSAFTRVQTSGCIIRGILAKCRRNTQMLFFGQVACLQTLFHFFLSFC